MLLENFNAVEHKDKIVQWIRDWFEENGKGCKAVIGISGGKDSSVAASLCVEALGKDNVIGVIMPNSVMDDFGDAERVCEFLGISHYVIDIGRSVSNLQFQMVKAMGGTFKFPDQALINLPPRMRMTTLYMVSQSIGGRVVCTDNLSESYIGYSTRWGDNIGDFAPLANYTASEVIAIGDALGLPQDLVHKTPSDGLCGMTDEDRFGFTYEQLDTYIRTGKCDSEAVAELIRAKHKANRFKQMTLPQPYSFQRIYGWE